MEDLFALLLALGFLLLVSGLITCNGAGTKSSRYTIGNLLAFIGIVLLVVSTISYIVAKSV